MRCPGCNKFARYEALDPETEDLRVEPDAGISGTCRIVLACEEDGEELKEATVDIDVDCGEEIAEHTGDGHDLEVEADDAEATQRQEGTGRGAKTFYGAKLTLRVTCSCKGLGDEGNGVTFAWEDDIQASHMDEMV